MKREHRYLVVKWADLNAALTNDEKDQLERLIINVSNHRMMNGKPERRYVVISDSNPELYEQGWATIASRQITQIASGALNGDNVQFGNNHIVTALCDDGTVWQYSMPVNNGSGEWEQLPEIPQ